MFIHAGKTQRIVEKLSTPSFLSFYAEMNKLVPVVNICSVTQCQTHIES